ncbi:MAG: signal peptidase I [Candidatus Gracilibacteria bacterium]|nr:signal peptidase I [Candidatus Gracilibacteria bacterium]
MDKNDIIDFFKDLVFIVVVVVIIKTFLAMPFQINGQSMYGSYYDKEFIIVDRLSYYLTEPKRGDVIVFKPYISDERKYFLKRIIGIPGDIVKIEEGKVFLKKSGTTEYNELDEKYLNSENKGFTFVGGSKAMHQYTLSEGQYFVLGDNRNHSTDSRECFSSCAIEGRNNFINDSDITGRVLLDLGYFNFKSFSFMQPNLGIDSKPRFFDSPSSFDY